MLADVARSGRTEDRIDRSVDRDVGIAMSGKAPGVLYVHAAQPQLFPFGEAMDVRADADADGWHVGKILCESELAQGFVAFNDGDVHPGLHPNLGVIPGDRRIAPDAMRGENGRVMERLRGLDPAQLLAWCAAGHHRTVSLGEAVDDGQG